MRRLLRKPILFVVIGFSLLINVGVAFADDCTECDAYQATHDAILEDFNTSQGLITDLTTDIGTWWESLNGLSPVPPVQTFFDDQVAAGNLLTGSSDCSGTGYPYYSMYDYNGTYYCNLDSATMMNFMDSILMTYGEFVDLEPYPTDIYNAYVNLNPEITTLMDLDVQLGVSIDDLLGCYEDYPYCGPCEVDGDCGEGYSCIDWTCVADGAPECETDACCDEGYVCMDGVCIEDTGAGGVYTCETDACCPDGYICVGGVCEEENGSGAGGSDTGDEDDCESDAECGTYEMCVDGECVDMYCEDYGDCSVGYTCEGSMYTETSCVDDADCETGWSCVYGWCVDLIGTGISVAEAEDCTGEEGLVCELCDPCPNCDDLIDLWEVLDDMANDLEDNMDDLLEDIDGKQAELDHMEWIKSEWERMVEENGGQNGDDCEDLRDTPIGEFPDKHVWGVAHRFGDAEYCFRNESDLEDFIDDLEEWNDNNPGAKANADEMDRLRTDIENLWDIFDVKWDAWEFIIDWMDDLEEEIDECIFELELCQLLGLCLDEEVPDFPPGEGDDEDDEEDDDDDDDQKPEPPAGAGDDDDDEDDGWPEPPYGPDGFPGYPYPEGPIGTPDDWPEEDVDCPDCDAVAANLDEAIAEYNAILDLIELIEAEIDVTFESLDDLYAQRENDFERIVKEAGGKTGGDCDGFTPGPGQATGSYQRFGDIPYCFTTEAQVEEFLRLLKEYDDGKREDPDTPTEKELSDKIFDLWDIWSDLMDVLDEAEEWMLIKAAALDACIELLEEMMENGYCEGYVIPVTPELPDEDGEESILDIIGHWAESFIETLLGQGIVSGYEDGSFGPNGPVLRNELAKMGWNAFGDVTRADVTDPGFSDVSESDWYYEYVAYVTATGCAEGYEDGTYKPLEEIERVEALKMLLCLAGVDVEAEGIPEADYPDILMNVWYSDYLDYATNKGYVSGYEDGTFGPSNSLLRGEISKVVVLIMQDLGLI